MIESLRNLQTSEIELKQQLPPPEGEWLLGRLLAKQGVANARWMGNARRLFIEYDANLFGCAELIAFLRYCGVPVAAVRVGMGHPGARVRRP
jgi:hypothetical protein